MCLFVVGFFGGDFCFVVDLGFGGFGFVFFSFFLFGLLGFF